MDNRPPNYWSADSIPIEGVARRQPTKMACKQRQEVGRAFDGSERKTADLSTTERFAVLLRVLTHPLKTFVAVRRRAEARLN
jgi:hypothetical protein